MTKKIRQKNTRTMRKIEKQEKQDPEQKSEEKSLEEMEKELQGSELISIRTRGDATIPTSCFLVSRSFFAPCNALNRSILTLVRCNLLCLPWWKTTKASCRRKTETYRRKRRKMHRIRFHDLSPLEGVR